MLSKEHFTHIGTVGRTHGVSGEIAMRLSVDISELAHGAEPLFLMLEEQGLLIPYRVVGHRSKAGDIDLLRLDRISSREEAELLTSREVWLDNSYIGDDEESDDPYDWQRYVGYLVLDAQSGAPVGEVIEVDDSTLNTLLYIDRAGQELILPIAEALLRGLDDDERVLALDIPEGLLDDSAEYDIHD